MALLTFSGLLYLSDLSLLLIYFIDSIFKYLRTSVSQDLKNVDIFYQIFKTVLLFSSWVCLGFNFMCYEERKYYCLHLAKYYFSSDLPWSLSYTIFYMNLPLFLNFKFYSLYLFIASFPPVFKLLLFHNMV